MRIQTQVIFYVLCVNVAVIIVLHLNVPGVSYASGLSNGLGSIADIQGRFNATDIGNRLGQNPVLGFLDFLSSGVSLLAGYIGYFLFGFAAVLSWFGPMFIQDAAGLAAYNFLVGVFGAVFGLLIVIWLIEFVSGRQLFD